MIDLDASKSRLSFRRALIAGAGALALCSTLVAAQSAPKSLLPPGFDEPVPSPTPAPRASAAPKTAAPAVTVTRPGTVPDQSGTMVQPLPGAGLAQNSEAGSSATSLSLSDLESMEPDQLDDLLGLKPKFDIPAAARRGLTRVGVLSAPEGGLPPLSLAKQPASIVNAALAGTKGPLVSRWGHILLRRALVSRLEAPAGMDPVDFAALRAGVLNRIGEYGAARALVQDVDTNNWNSDLTTQALAAYVATADLVGACPAVRLQGSQRDDPHWQLLESICDAFAGQGAQANSDLNRALARNIAPDIDVLLAQRYAGAAGLGRRAVTLEWKGVTDMNPWRFALATAVGAEIPPDLVDNAGPYYQLVSATAPMLPLAQRAAGVELASSEGILSSEAMVDFYAQIYADNQIEGDLSQTSVELRDAYAARTPEERIAAMKSIWGDGKDYSRIVMTAYAAARIPVSDAYSDAAPQLIASMLTAGLDRNAQRWASLVPDGSQGWALLLLSRPQAGQSAQSDQMDTYIGDDESAHQRKSKFLLAGLAGLGRINQAESAKIAAKLSIDIAKRTKWSQLIDEAAAVNNQALVAYLAGVGMQGKSWDQMTARHLYHIVSALNGVGMGAEARMIAAEAIARA